MNITPNLELFKEKMGLQNASPEELLEKYEWFLRIVSEAKNLSYQEGYNDGFLKDADKCKCGECKCNRHYEDPDELDEGDEFTLTYEDDGTEENFMLLKVVEISGIMYLVCISVDENADNEEEEFEAELIVFTIDSECVYIMVDNELEYSAVISLYNYLCSLEDEEPDTYNILFSDGTWQTFISCEIVETESRRYYVLTPESENDWSQGGFVVAFLFDEENKIFERVTDEADKAAIIAEYDEMMSNTEE